MKHIIGYTRDIIGGAGEDTKTQMKLILDFCNQNGFQCYKFFKDIGIRKNRHSDERERAGLLGLKTTRGRYVYPEWEKMLLEVLEDKVEMIIVDCSYRLYSNKEQKEVLQTICNKHNVRIVEVKYENTPSDNANKKVAFYHFSIPRRDANDHRTTGILRDLGMMYEWASSHESWEPTSLYIDETLDKRKEYPLLTMNNNVNIIAVKSFYHVKRKPSPFLEEIRKYQDKGIKVVSMEQGGIVLTENNHFFSEFHKAAVYELVGLHYNVEKLKRIKKRIDLFFSYKAEKWRIFDYFIDPGDSKTVLEELVNRAEKGKKFDVILVESFSVFRDISILFDTIHRSGCSVYSMKEGEMLYEETDEISSNILCQSVDDT